MIAKSKILLRVQRFQQSRRRVTPKISAHFVNFIHHEDRIVAAALLQPLQDATRHGTNVSASVASNFGFITDSAQRNTNELAP